MKKQKSLCAGLLALALLLTGCKVPQNGPLAPLQGVGEAQNSAAVGAGAQTQAAVDLESSVVLTITGVDEQVEILPAEEVELVQGDTVFDVLLRVTKTKKIQMEFSGSKSSAYVMGIDNLYEFDKGEGSGWMFYINGEAATKSAGAYQVTTGDDIKWSYTKDFGKDLEAKGD